MNRLKQAWLARKALQAFLVVTLPAWILPALAWLIVGQLLDEWESRRRGK